ncbi:ABC transporter substrate-binding protein [Alicyclobacillus dauci]|uniref:ABC transporter substrate-binding protein n=1 Tax=Alicyclobacillus dauci TaxID=1475485 RepID=A0ABY6Z966_9BACL|nr:ABC transporter substrate-binding protein [Alicyclobacillus dauci]WAH38711.1 ABC transporter substrate-binding protein [Alicyclobacillus dauci]
MKRSSQFATVLACALALSVLVTACGSPSSQNSAGNETNTTGQAAKATFPVTLTDDAGKQVTVKSMPQHIASGTEGTDEILVSLIPTSKISLVTNLSSDPTYSNVVNQVKGIPQMSNADAEKILSVHPDLVLLASYVKPGIVDQIRNSGVPVYEFNDFTSVDSIEKNIKVVGQLVGATDKANALVNNINSNIKQIQSAVSGDGSPSVLDYSSYGFAGGKNTTVNDIIQDAGGTNAAANLDGWQKISDEEIVKMNPDVIIDSEADKAFLTKLAQRPDLQSVTAIRKHQMYAIPDADLSSVSQYIVKGMVDLAKDIHPKSSIPNLQVMQ